MCHCMFHCLWSRFFNRPMMVRAGMPEAVANNMFDAPTPGTDMLVAVVIGRWHLLSEPPRPGSDASVIWKGLSLASGLLSHVMHDHGEALWLPPDPIGISSRNIWDILPLLANVVRTSGGQPSRFPDWQVRMSHALGNNGQLDPILVRVCPALAVAVAMNLWKILHVVPRCPRECAMETLAATRSCASTLTRVCEGADTTPGGSIRTPCTGLTPPVRIGGAS